MKTKFGDRFFLNFFSTLIDHCTIKFPKFVSIENSGSCLTWAQKWVNFEVMSYIWLSFCSGTSYCLEFSTISNSHAARENLPHLVALWNPSEIWSGNAVEWEKTKANRQQELVNFSTEVAVVVFCSFVLFFLFLLLLSIKCEKKTLALIAHVNKIFQDNMCMTFQLNKMPFLALELPRFLAFDMDQWGKHRGHHWKKRLKISKIWQLWNWHVFSKWRLAP